MTRKFVAYLVAACAALMIAPALGSAATFTVDTEADAVPAANACTPAAAMGQTCSVREAFIAAGASPDNDDTVVIPAGDYKLTQGQLNLADTAGAGALTVDGAGARSTILDAQGASRVINFTAGTVVIDDLTITGGKSALADATALPGDGGGIISDLDADGALTLNRVALVGNTAEQNGEASRLHPRTWSTLRSRISA